MNKITMQSKSYQHVKKNLMLENFSINSELAQRAIDLVNSNKKITLSVIKEALWDAKI
ncbi:hypothetical protein [Rummeliibacillus sp. SL167]|uniref:hypothetical protein n=1 Tax=Rummeliibacillus sp. SL167 TaxID=2579792 RepID=UPI001645376A|nr:hypothetical protein [Rummeliibacillus sp. SL167]